jgi:hypothetical protein
MWRLLRNGLALLALLIAGSAYAQTGPAPAFPHADGENCEVAGEFPKGVDEEGAVQDCTAAGGGGPFMPIAGGTFTGNVSFGDTIELVFGTAGETTIQWNGSAFVVDPYTVGGGYTDFTGAIRVSEDEDVFSMFGADPTNLNPSDAADALVVRKARSVNT